MKQFITLAICTMSSMALLAQNPMFCNFEMQYDGVYEWLAENGTAKIIGQDGKREIVVEHNDALLTYRFHQGRLYEIEMLKTYDSKKSGKEAYDGCMRYLRMIASEGVEFESGKGRSCQISEKSGKLYELALREQDEQPETYVLQLISKDPRLMPLSDYQKSRLSLSLDEGQTLEYLQRELAKNQRFKFL